MFILSQDHDALINPHSNMVRHEAYAQSLDMSQIMQARLESNGTFQMRHCMPAFGLPCYALDKGRRQAPWDLGKSPGHEL